MDWRMSCSLVAVFFASVSCNAKVLWGIWASAPLPQMQYVECSGIVLMIVVISLLVVPQGNHLTTLFCKSPPPLFEQQEDITGLRIAPNAVEVQLVTCHKELLAPLCVAVSAT